MVITALAELRHELAQVDTVLQSILAERAGSLAAPAQEIFDAGGKRLRPALVLLVAKMFGPVEPGVYKIAAAVEMIHGASLIHDDVIDGTDTRRGVPTLNTLKGNQFSVLLGDFLLCQALLAVSELGRVDLLQVISQGVADMTQGQILEASLQGNLEASEQEYLDVVQGKTAALMAAGCELAAICCGASAPDVAAVREFGRNLGLAFQITDDVLDIWGDPEILGKPIGSDLQEKKYTLPFLISYKASQETEKAEVRKLLSNGHYPGEHVPELVNWMDRHQARKHSTDQAQHYITLAQEALLKLPSGKSRDELSQLLDVLLERQK